MATQRRSRRSLRLLGVVLAIGLVAAACGDDDDDDAATDTASGEGTTASTEATTEETTAGTSTPTEGGSTTETSAGSEAAAGEVDPSLEPFRIGWASMDEGQIPLPGETDGAVAAVAYINEQLGGINGRAIELLTCSVDSTNETNQACGQEHANDDTLDLTVVGISTAAGPYYEAVAPTGLPIVNLAPVTPADFAGPENLVAYYSGGAGTYVGFAEIALSIGAESVAFLQLDNPGGQAGLADLEAMLEGTDVELRSVPVAATATDLLTPLTAVDAASADLVIVGVPNCVPAAEALQTLGATSAVASISACFSPANLASSSDIMAGWYVPMYTRNPLEGMGQDDEMDLFLTEYPEYASLPTEDGIPSQANNGWAGLLTIHAVLSELDAAALDDPAAVTEALKGFTGPLVMGPETIDCNSGNEQYPSVCTLDNVYYQVEGSGLVEVDV
jgi:branched-chain amino acid transport system substrate-binding protein